MSLITVSAIIEAPMATTWDCWVQPQHVMHWNHASDDWHCPQATSDFNEGGEFHYTMSAKDDSFTFDFWGTFLVIVPHQLIEIRLGDGRSMKVIFEEHSEGTLVTETFEAETMNSEELQQAGWQLILYNFKGYAESQAQQL